MEREAAILDAVGRMYEAAVDPARLPDIGTALRSALGVNSGIIFVCEQASGRMLHLLHASDNFDEKAQADYAAHYHGINPWFGKALLRKPPITARGEELVDMDAFARSEFATDWCDRVGIYHMIGSVRQVAPDIVVGAGIHKTRGEGPFDDDEKAHYDLVCGHLGRALQLAWRLRTFEGQALASLDAMHTLGAGLILLDRDCRIVFANAVAERLASRARWIAVAAGILRPVHPADRAAFAGAVNAAADATAGANLAGGTLLRLLDPIEGALSVFVAPFRSDNLGLGEVGPVAIVQFTDPDHRRAPESGAIEKALGLTRAEAALVASLAAGRTLAEHAAGKGISLNTAKTLLARAFSRTGTSRQSELVARAFADPLLRAGRRPTVS